MMLENFISEYTGKVVSFDNVPSLAGQSTQLIAAWCRFIGLPFQWANAADWWDDSDDTFLDHWDKVVNDRKNADQLPKPGDIIIFDSSLPGSGGFGHQSIFIRKIGDNSWDGFDANWGGKSAHLQNHNWSYVLGWFTPKRPAVVEGPTPTPIAEEAPSSSFDQEEIEPRAVTLKTNAWLYNLNNVDWESFQQNPQGLGVAGEEIIAVSVAKHRLGGTYYMSATGQPYGYRVTDCDEHDGSGASLEVPEEQVGKKVDKLPKAPIMAPITKPFKIEAAIPKYASMGDAINSVNSTGEVPVGDYYLYKSLEGMQCITNKPGYALGWWINPDDMLSDQERLKLNWRTTYKPFRDQYGNIRPRYYEALNDDPVPDLESQHRDLAITRKQPILIRGWFTGPDGIEYGRPDDCVKKELLWYGVRRANLQPMPEPEPDEEVPIELEVTEEIANDPSPSFRDKMISIVPPSVSRVFDIVKPK